MFTIAISNEGIRIGIWRTISSASPITFEPDAWRKNEASLFSAHARERMAYELIASNQLLGMKQSDVISMLGPSEHDYYRGQRRSLSYILYHAGYKSVWLVVELDELDMVKTANVYFDG